MAVKTDTLHLSSDFYFTHNLLLFANLKKDGEKGSGWKIPENK
jgi:hypothetical protein